MKIKEIDIPDELIDFIMELELLRSYKTIKKDLKSKKSLHPDDREHMEQLFEAIKIVGDYYVYNFRGKAKLNG